MIFRAGAGLQKRFCDPRIALLSVGMVGEVDSGARYYGLGVETRLLWRTGDYEIGPRIAMTFPTELVKLGTAAGLRVERGPFVVGIDIIATFGERDYYVYAPGEVTPMHEHPFSIGGYGVLGLRGARVGGGTLVAGLLVGLGVVVLASIAVPN